LRVGQRTARQRVDLRTRPKAMCHNRRIGHRCGAIWIRARRGWHAQRHHPSHQTGQVSMIDSHLTTDIDVLVVGAGQAGLAAGMALRHAGLRFIIVDAAEPGGSWPRDYDSLTLFHRPGSADSSPAPPHYPKTRPPIEASDYTSSVQHLPDHAAAPSASAGSARPVGAHRQPAPQLLADRARRDRVRGRAQHHPRPSRLRFSSVLPAVWSRA
jgi:hypothetical protein